MEHISVYIVCLLVILIVLLQSWYSSYQSNQAYENGSFVYSIVFESRINRIIRTSNQGINVIINKNNQTAKNHTRIKCAAFPPGLGNGRLSDDFLERNGTPSSLRDLMKRHPDVKPGGVWEPRDCEARHRLAIVIPYRDRWPHLLALLNRLLPLLKLQEIKFQIFVVEQNGTLTFNKGKLMNAGYIEALKGSQWDCFVFHDVDLLPERIHTLYTCPALPRHVSAAIDEMGYVLPYSYLVGGVFILRTEHFLQLNGYSNLYWGWGSEDDDMAKRVKLNFRIDRLPYTLARFKQISHTKREPAPWKIRHGKLFKSELRIHKDGVNNVKYELVSKIEQPLFTHIMINVGQPPS